MAGKKTGDKPWCLTVGFQNPHDHEFYPAGTEYQTFTNLFPYNQTIGGQSVVVVQAINYSVNPSATGISWANNQYASGKSILNGYRYPALPPNWESIDSLYANKPTWQLVGRQWLAMQFGGVTESAVCAFLSLQWKMASWLALYTCMSSVANVKKSQADYKQIFCSVM